MTKHNFTEEQIAKIEAALTSLKVGKYQPIGRFVIAKTDDGVTRVFLPSGKQADCTVRQFIIENMDLVGNAIQAAKARKGTANPIVLEEDIAIEGTTTPFGLEYKAVRY